MAEACGLRSLYDDSRACLLAVGHTEPHRASDGYRWQRYEETYAEGTADEGVDEWEEEVSVRQLVPPLPDSRPWIPDTETTGVRVLDSPTRTELRAGAILSFTAEIIL
jgi:hypothetical protein